MRTFTASITLMDQKYPPHFHLRVKVELLTPKKRLKRKFCFSKPFGILEISGFSSLFSRTFWIQMTLQFFLWMIWQLLIYFKDHIRLWFSSARQIVTIRCVKVELRGRKREKNKIYFFRAKWDSWISHFLTFLSIISELFDFKWL